jgi:glycosyltransferase involved in cell wall biosynthesis
MLKRAIDSILDQTFTDWELIIVDDSSKDDTNDIVKGYNDKRIKFFTLGKNSGGSYLPRQVGLQSSTGKYIAVLDDDDIWIDNRKLELQVKYLEEHSECVLVGTDAVSTNGDGKESVCINFPKNDQTIRNRLLIWNCFCHSAVIYRRETIDTIGSYNIVKGGFYNGQCNEYDLWARMGLVGKLANLPIYGVGYNNQSRNISFNDRLIFLKMYVDLIMKYRGKYPNWILALVYQTVFTMLELPGLAQLKNVGRKILRG